LLEARQKDSRQKRAKVLAVVDEMKDAGDRITFLGVARAAGVSNWLVYSDGVREHIEAARKGQSSTKSRQKSEGSTASTASLTTDLELTRAELRRVREDRDKLKGAVQRALGQQVDQAGSTDLIARINELTTQLQHRDEALAAVTTVRDQLQTALTEAQDDLIAARSALRNMMRDQNRPE
jgi:seryl-tRNA synthetase